MNDIHILDCTLRDGGYCNGWKFYNRNIPRIINGLNESGVEIIECGFLTSKVEYDLDYTLYTDITQVDEHIKKSKACIVIMINYGEYDVSLLPDKSCTKVDGIRLAFHKKDSKNALQICKEIQRKGYKLFVQPMVSLNYSKEEFIELCSNYNELNPYAFYIVDSFGSMTKQQLQFYFEIADVILKDAICIGFHSHNNMQLAYSNSQMLTELYTERTLIIDASIMGMGRGAGNLNTELFVEYLNRSTDNNYKIVSLLELIDSIINNFYSEKKWGYSLENYISAKHDSHPNYAAFLSQKNSLNYEDMNAIFEMMDDDKRVNYDENYARDLYKRYMVRNKSRVREVTYPMQEFEGKSVLLIGPGKSASHYKEKVYKYIQEINPVTIEINFRYPELSTDYLFLSNLRRFKEIEKEELKKAIVTSNIETDIAYKIVNYDQLRNNNDFVSDNAGMMAIKFCLLNKVSEIKIVGMDGYDFTKDNYLDDSMRMNMSRDEMERLNLGMKNQILEFMKSGKISFIVKPKYLEGVE